jgi:lipoprotein
MAQNLKPTLQIGVLLGCNFSHFNAQTKPHHTKTTHLRQYYFVGPYENTLSNHSGCLIVANFSLN